MSKRLSPLAKANLIAGLMASVMLSGLAQAHARPSDVTVEVIDGSINGAEGGLLEADLTVTKLDVDRYWVVATDTAHRHVETRMRRHFGDHHAIVTDVTSGYAQLNVQGPQSREVLQSITSVDLSNEAFPFRAARYRRRISRRT